MTYFTLLTASRMDEVVKTAGIAAVLSGVTIILTIAFIAFLLFYLFYGKEAYGLGGALKEFFIFLFVRVPSITCGFLLFVTVAEAIGFALECFNALW